MNSTDLSCYIGIPHIFGTSSFSSCDCIGLCKLVYVTEGLNEPLDDNAPIGTKEDDTKHPLRILRYMLKNMDKVKGYDELNLFDIVAFRIAGDLHFGIFAGYGRVLAMAVPVIYGYSKSTLYRKVYIQQFYVCGFRSRKENVNGNISTPIHL